MQKRFVTVSNQQHQTEKGQAVKTKDRDEFVAVFVENAVKTAGGDALVACKVAGQIMRLAATHNRLSVENCNRNLTEREKKRLASVEKQVSALCNGKYSYGIKPKFGGDPRGYTIKLIFPNGRNNTWGGEADGWGVPCNG